MKKNKQKGPVIACFEYKCRRCSNINRSTEASEKNAHSYLLEAIFNMRLISDNGHLRLLETHICPDGGMGITDLIGYELLRPQGRGFPTQRPLPVHDIAPLAKFCKCTGPENHKN